MSARGEEQCLIELPADWIKPGVLVVGHLAIWMTGIVFRSLVPNPERSLEVPIADVDRVTTVSPHRLEVWTRADAQHRFLTTNPDGCALALHQALALHRTATAYR